MRSAAIHPIQPPLESFPRFPFARFSDPKNFLGSGETEPGGFVTPDPTSGTSMKVSGV